MDTYTLEPGRNIYRDGKPFVYLSMSREPGGFPNSPADADDFARLAVEAVNGSVLLRSALAEIVEAGERAARMAFEGGPGLKVAEILRPALTRARAALEGRKE